MFCFVSALFHQFPFFFCLFGAFCLFVLGVFCGVGFLFVWRFFCLGCFENYSLTFSFSRGVWSLKYTVSLVMRLLLSMVN